MLRKRCRLFSPTCHTWNHCIHYVANLWGEYYYPSGLSHTTCGITTICPGARFVQFFPTISFAILNWGRMLWRIRRGMAVLSPFSMICLGEWRSFWCLEREACPQRACHTGAWAMYVRRISQPAHHSTWNFHNNKRLVVVLVPIAFLVGVFGVSGWVRGPRGMSLALGWWRLHRSFLKLGVLGLWAGGFIIILLLIAAVITG